MTIPLHNNQQLVVPPKTCLLTVSNACHLKCQMCDLWKKDTAREELSIDECMHFVDQLNSFGGDPVELHLIGGETFIKDGIFDLITFARHKGARVVVTTSGYAITEPVAKKIAASQLSMLNFSLESLNPDVHDALRGVAGIHKKAMRALELVAEYSPSTAIGINTIIVKNNLHDLVDLVRWVDGHERLSHIYFMAVMRPFGSDLELYWQDTERAQGLWPREYADVELVLNKLTELKRNGSKIGNSTGQFTVFKNYFQHPQNFAKRTACTLDKHAINVNAIGDVYLCFFMESLGNIREKTVREMWYSEQAARVREQIKVCRKNCELVVNCYFEDE